MSPVRYKLGLYMPEDDILHSRGRETLKSYTTLTGWALWRRRNVPCEVRTGFLYPRRGHSSLSPPWKPQILLIQRRY
jgi:hypothetical protein